ncbi:hypothetical protein ACFRQM_44830 [Streptomyces sp. NPDC056831]|uniref:hypothetical protein n=1 Tax=Streptomyces sp. NPDC056831 TaxID=3345954 RepID=UPI0036C0F89E
MQAVFLVGDEPSDGGGVVSDDPEIAVEEGKVPCEASDGVVRRGDGAVADGAVVEIAGFCVLAEEAQGSEAGTLFDGLVAEFVVLGEGALEVGDPGPRQREVPTQIRSAGVEGRKGVAVGLVGSQCGAVGQFIAETSEELEDIVCGLRGGLRGQQAGFDGFGQERLSLAAGGCPVCGYGELRFVVGQVAAKVAELVVKQCLLGVDRAEEVRDDSPDSVRSPLLALRVEEDIGVGDFVLGLEAEEEGVADGRGYERVFCRRPVRGRCCRCRRSRSSKPWRCPRAS